MFSIFLCALGLISSSRAQSAASPDGKRAFTIYAFIPYKDHVSGGEISHVPSLDHYLDSIGLHKVDVVYENRFMTNGRADEKKIEAIAKVAKDSPAVPVSFDTEFGNRFHPETVIPEVLNVLGLFHQYNSITAVGVYATAPQNTYAWKADIDRFDKLNEQYAVVANKVDFLSPVLYNYEGPDTAAWIRAAVYNMAAARKYNTGKRVIPYVSPIIRLQDSGINDQSQRGAVRMLTEEEMKTRLQTLYNLGADGCIVWTSSGDRTSDGRVPVFDRSSGWGKALVDFANEHR
jgi:hypothetical protein